MWGRLATRTITNSKLNMIHSQMGVSRSAAIVAAHVMRHYKCDADKAIIMIRSHRPFVQPNLSFSAQLELFYAMGMYASTQYPNFDIKVTSIVY